MTVLEVHRRYEKLAGAHPRFLAFRPIGESPGAGGVLPVCAFDLHDRRRPAKNPPVFVLTAGVHGIEAIGVQLLHAFVGHLATQTRWNAQVRRLLRRVRITGIPIVNPAGYEAGTRANGRGVDLMRNAPVEAEAPVPFFGGQRLSALLPYWRGDGALEPEAKLLTDLVLDVARAAPFTLALDLHSGFGARTSLWTPYARRPGRPPTWREYRRIRNVVDEAIPHHRLRFEPQSVRYRTSGDLWDWMYDTAQGEGLVRRFYPLTLEIGTWRWLRRSPLDALHRFNYFNPSRPGRQRRVMERHVPLLALLAHAAANYKKVV